MDYIVYAIPAFFLLIGVELLVGVLRGIRTYRLNDALTSIGTGILMTSTGIVTKGIRLGLYSWVWHRFAVATVPDHWLSWLLALLGYDLCYYWYHRLSHERNLFWAAHVVHHQSEDYNLSTALRQTSTSFPYEWLFYLPLALAGVPPLMFVAVGAVNLLYQYWVHTQQVPKLGWLDRVLVTPSNHRVHHAQNPEYIDRNYGGILILWDRLFGTYAEERDEVPIIYGVRKRLGSWNPLRANLLPWWQLLRDARLADNWRDRLRLWLAPTGWRPPAAERAEPRPSVPLEGFEPFDIPLAPRLKGYVLGQFLLLLVASSAFLALAELWRPTELALGIGFLAAWLWIQGAMLEGQPRALWLEALRLSLTPAVIWLLGSGQGLAPRWLLAIAGIQALSLLWLVLAGQRRDKGAAGARPEPSGG